MGDNFLVRTDCEVRMHCNNSTLSQVPEMYEQMYVSPESAFSLTKCVTPVKMRVKSPWVESATPSVDCAFYDAYRADSRLVGRCWCSCPPGFAWGGSGAHNGRQVSGVG
jgi:hypothetical protein